MATSTKSIFRKTMKTGDYIKLAILLVFAIFCWSWVLYEYQKPFNYQLFEIQVLGGNNASI